MKILITGGTGSVGHALVRELLTCSSNEVTVFSRDESKQHAMRAEFPSDQLHLRLGDVRNYQSLARVARGVRLIIHCAAMKHVPACEQAPYEAALTNIGGSHNLIRAAVECQVPTVVGVSTDKACQPNGVMGYTKAIMEGLFVQASREHATKFVCVRFGNVVPSRGSVFGLFLRLLEEDKPLTVTSKHMTRFLLPIHRVPRVVLDTAEVALSGEIWVPLLSAAYIGDIAEVLRGDRDNPIRYIGARPGEKLHEHMVTEDESRRTYRHSDYYIICPPGTPITPTLDQEYCSRYNVVSKPKLRDLLDKALGEAWSP